MKTQNGIVTIDTDNGELTGWFTYTVGTPSRSFYEQDSPDEVEFTEIEYSPITDYLDKSGEPKVKSLNLDKLSDKWIELLEEAIEPNCFDEY